MWTLLSSHTSTLTYGRNANGIIPYGMFLGSSNGTSASIRCGGPLFINTWTLIFLFRNSTPKILSLSWPPNPSNSSKTWYKLQLIFPLISMPFWQRCPNLQWLARLRHGSNKRKERKEKSWKWKTLTKAVPHLLIENMPTEWPLLALLGNQYVCDIPLSLTALHLCWF